ncbi:MAG: hypothetical protein Tsb0033_06590 [Winogradskyella sp.]
MLKRIWKDPVGSKVIAVGILGVLSLIYAKIISVSDDITFSEAYERIFEIKIRLIYVVGGIFLFLLFKRIFTKKKGYYSSKQKKLREFNKTTDPNTDIMFRWGVYFDYDTPFISDLTAFCTKHEGPPIRFVNDRCTLRDCENHRNRIDLHMVKNLIESDLIDRWEKIK